MSFGDVNAQQRIRHLRHGLTLGDLTLDDLQDAVDLGLVTKANLAKMHENERTKIAGMLLKQTIEDNMSLFKVCYISSQDAFQDYDIYGESPGQVNKQHLIDHYGLEESPFDVDEIREMAADETVPGISLKEDQGDRLDAVGIFPTGYVLTKDGTIVYVMQKIGLEFKLY